MPLQLNFDNLNSSNESAALATFLGLITIQLGSELVTRYMQRIEKTKEILEVYMKESPKESNISRRELHMKYSSDPIHINNINKLLTVCKKCVDYVYTANNKLDLARVASLLNECGYEFELSEHSSSKETIKRKNTVNTLLSAGVSAVSMAGGGGTVAGATCATIAIGLMATGLVNIGNRSTPVLYGSIGINSVNDIAAQCKKWLAVYSVFENTRNRKYVMPKLELRLMDKLLNTVCETMRYTGMALRSYISCI